MNERRALYPFRRIARLRIDGDEWLCSVSVESVRRVTIVGLVDASRTATAHARLEGGRLVLDHVSGSRELTIGAQSFLRSAIERRPGSQLYPLAAKDREWARHLGGLD